MVDLTNVPGFRIEKELGKGGMADVYLAVQENLDRQVAIKVLAPELLRDENFAKRFIKEAQTAAKLSHPNIMTIHDVGQSGHSYFIIMEYLAGGSLKERIRRRPLPPAEALGIVGQVASALQYAHEKGYIHRDIKPDNIMFRVDGTAVLTDFGIARAIDSSTKLTKTGMSIGTPHYMSPEQARSKQLDCRSDLYSLGIVLYEMLTGKVPYDAEDSVAIAIQHIQEPLPMLPNELAQYQHLLDKLLAKNPDDRFQTTGQLREFVDGIFSGAQNIVPQKINILPVPEPAWKGLEKDSLSGSSHADDLKKEKGLAVPGELMEFTNDLVRVASQESLLNQPYAQAVSIKKHHFLKYGLIIIGILLVLLMLTADLTGLGGAPGFGWKQIVGLVIGINLIVIGAVLFSLVRNDQK